MFTSNNTEDHEFDVAFALEVECLEDLGRSDSVGCERLDRLLPVDGEGGDCAGDDTARRLIGRAINTPRNAGQDGIALGNRAGGIAGDRDHVG